MTVIFYSYTQDGDYERIGAVKNSEIIEGEDRLEGVLLEREMDDEQAIIEHYNGPYLIAEMYPDGDAPGVQDGDEDVDEDERAGDQVATSGDETKSDIAGEAAEVVTSDSGVGETDGGE